MKVTLALVATIFAIIGNVPYLRDVLRKKVQPHPYTWLVWSLVSGISFLGQYVKGAGIGALPTGVAESFTIIIFFFSLRYGFRNIKHIDTVFLICALLGLIPWYITNDPTLSVVIVVAMDVVAFIPTLRKTWSQPSTETPTLYSMNVLRHILTLFSLEAYNVATTLHSFAMIVTNSMMTAFIVRGKSRFRR
ncbi:MAG: hypothetical protein Q7R81_03730 [Candidatus Peregrinibacteria bacterium]|nr:hypothetical protein [Candidatus Peregrinibacteria bacterium]